MDYKAKYLKYKLKYLNYKKNKNIHGGMIPYDLNEINTHLLSVVNQEIFKSSYKHFLESIPRHSLINYIDDFQTNYLTNTLENFEDVSLKKKQDKLLEHVDINYINQLKKTIIKNTRFFRDITSSINSLDNHPIRNNVINEYSENLDPRNPNFR